jgi:lysozyme
VGIALIKRFEGLELEAYKDIAGIWTIGYGHTGPDVQPGMRISEREAEELLKRDLRPREEAVEKLASVSLNQNEFDALVSFIYNVGIEAFRKSTARRRLNANDRVGAAEALTWWNKATVGGVLREVRGLTRRRAAERALFLEPTEPAPVANNNQIAENSRITPIEDAPRRPNLIESRSLQGATVAGGAGVASSTIGRENTQISQPGGAAAAGGGEMPDSSAGGASTGATDAGTGASGDAPAVNGGATGDGDATTGDATTGGAPTVAPTPSLSDTRESVEVSADRPVIERESADEQIQVALLILIVLSVAYIFFARLDDWWRYRR